MPKVAKQKTTITLIKAIRSGLWSFACGFEVVLERIAAQDAPYMHGMPTQSRAANRREIEYRCISNRLI